MCAVLTNMERLARQVNCPFTSQLLFRRANVFAEALEEGVTPQELCDKYFKIHAEIYEWFEIGFDVFGRTSTTKQKQITQGIFRQLYQNGYTSQHTSRQPYCENHKAFLADRYIEGTCPKCGYEDARGDQCDSCQSVVSI